MTLIFVYRSLKVMSTMASHSPLNVSEIVRGLIPNDANRKWHMGHQMVTWQMTSVTPKGQIRETNTLRARLSRKQRGYYLPTIANY